MPTRLLTKGSLLACALTLLLTCALTLLLASKALRAVPPPPTGPLVAADNRFAFRLFHVLTADATRNENVFVSPSSVALALGMTYAGAGGATRAAMGHALSLEGLSLEQTSAESRNLQAALKSADPQVRLTIANDLWADTGTRIDPTFARNARRYYGAGVTILRLDPSAAAIINARVGEETQGKITGLLSPSDFNGPVPLILTDAVYFHGRWSAPFDKADTRPGPFARPGSPRKTLPTMARTGEMGYYQGNGFQEVKLPYGQGRFTLDVLLPARSSSLPNLLKRLDDAHWQNWDTHTTSKQVDLTLPRFKVAVTSDLNAPLAALGMGVAFTSDADFRPMSPAHVKVSEVRQKAMLDVDEEGTTAAAATGVIAAPTAVPVFAPPAVMHVDRPFLCVLQDSATGTILFMGAITDPQ